MDATTKMLLERASQTIKQFREITNVMETRLRMFDDVMALVHGRSGTNIGLVTGYGLAIDGEIDEYLRRHGGEEKSMEKPPVNKAEDDGMKTQLEQKPRLNPNIGGFK